MLWRRVATGGRIAENSRNEPASQDLPPGPGATFVPEDEEKDELEAPEKAPAPEPAPVPVPDPGEGLPMSLGWRKYEPVSNGS